MTEYPRFVRLDPEAAVERIRAAGGPGLTVVGALPGGAVGAALVRWPDGRDAVLKVSGPPIAGAPVPATTATLMEAARAVGVPAPRYEAVFDLPDGSVAVVQERARGVAVQTVTDALVERLLELARRRVGRVPSALRTSRSPLYLTSDGPGFCLHAPMREYSAATRDLLQRIETIGATTGDAVGDDIVHFDYHMGNVLVAPDDADAIVAIVDWGGARAGSIGLDLVILTFDLAWQSDRLSGVVERELRALVTADEFVALWAHGALRLVDFAIRHYPTDVDHWVNFSNRRL